MDPHLPSEWIYIYLLVHVLQMGDGWYEIVTLFLVYIIFIIGSCV